MPIVVGDCPPQQVAAVLDALWGGDETLVVVSSDLSHFHGYETANALDAETSSAIEAHATDLTGEQACGAHAINGLLLSAAHHRLAVRTLARCNSGDTAGDRTRVVGYGSYAIG